MRPQLRFLLPAVTAALALALGLLITLDSPSNQAPAPSEGFDGAALPTDVRAPDFTLSNQQGRSVSLSSYRGHVIVLAFLSTDCRRCVLVAQQVRGALDELGPSAMVRTIFVSTDPRVDTRVNRTRFLADTSLIGRAEYVAGTRARLRPVWNAYRISPRSAGKTASETAITVSLIDSRGIERVGFGLEQITPEGMSHDIRLLGDA